MPWEFRQIVLSPDELVQAIAAYRRMDPDRVPAGEIVAVDLSDSRGPVVQLAAGSEAGRFLMPTDVIVETLVRFCIENNVPVPRESRKSWRIVNGRIGLLIQLGH